jgi:hypothetical protein
VLNRLVPPFCNFYIRPVVNQDRTRHRMWVSESGESREKGALSNVHLSLAYVVISLDTNEGFRVAAGTDDSLRVLYLTAEQRGVLERHFRDPAVQRLPHRIQNKKDSHGDGVRGWWGRLFGRRAYEAPANEAAELLLDGEGDEEKKNDEDGGGEGVEPSSMVPDLFDGYLKVMFEQHAVAIMGPPNLKSR